MGLYTICITLQDSCITEIATVGCLCTVNDDYNVTLACWCGEHFLHYCIRLYSNDKHTWGWD